MKVVSRQEEPRRKIWSGALHVVLLLAKDKAAYIIIIIKMFCVLMPGLNLLEVNRDLAFKMASRGDLEASL